MQDCDKDGPLSSSELERDQNEAGTGTTLTEGDAPGHTLPASETAIGSGTERRDDKGSGSAVGAVSGTILPPD